ncbi:MAG: aminopeptidase P family protein [Deltaproteobacteria bacterium]|nr:aminopeptidase P family protein [Deltaproteobacteria bacterium]
MNDIFKVPAKEINARIRKIQETIQAQDIDALLVIQRVDLFYFTGSAQNGFLFVPAEGPPLFMVKRYMHRAREESPLAEIVEIRSVKEIPGLIQDYYGRLPERIGFELDVIPVRDFNFYRSLFPRQEIVDASPLILKLRSRKSAWEIEQMENTAELSRKTFEYMRHIIRPGQSEMEFAGLFEAYARKLGHGGKMRVRDYQTEGYPWHVLSGKSGSMVGLLDSPASGQGTSPAFPCGAGPKALVPNEPIMVDLASVLNGYHMDETRMFAMGAMPDKALKASHAAIEIHQAVLEKTKPGLQTGEIFGFAHTLAEKLGYGDVYLGLPGYKVNFIAHGIGLELIEPPFIAQGKQEILEPGMTFALEPKMVFPDEFCVGVESVFLVTETGSRLISKVPVEIFVCS